MSTHPIPICLHGWRSTPPLFPAAPDLRSPRSTSLHPELTSPGDRCLQPHKGRDEREQNTVIIIAQHLTWAVTYLHTLKRRELQSYRTTSYFMVQNICKSVLALHGYIHFGATIILIYMCVCVGRTKTKQTLPDAIFTTGWLMEIFTGMVDFFIGSSSPMTPLLS